MDLKIGDMILQSFILEMAKLLLVWIVAIFETENKIHIQNIFAILNTFQVSSFSNWIYIQKLLGSLQTGAWNMKSGAYA